MFGYVTINRPELKIKDEQTYRAFYCGLCRALKKRHGVTGQSTLSYDMTFVALLLSALYEPETEEDTGYCLIHPVQSGSVAEGQHVINTGTPPRFRLGTFVPSPRSPAVNAGLVLPWMAGAYDLQRDAAGNPTTPRIYGAGVDMGAFEYMPTDGFIFLFR